MLAVRLVDAVEDRLDVALDDRERRPQLVADVGEERPALGLAGLEPAGHRVEAADEVADGPRRAVRDRDPHGVVALFDLLGGDEQRVERRRARPDPVARPGERDRGEDQDRAARPAGRGRPAARPSRSR
jgi:hypothetical protein